ncbi:MAG: glycosyltransferase N-terminal domain-containing protein [Verrucomicrobiae bacterium]|nr:glycosyltransferase N-terminal domain-containing protein [Verrucomicrobiae bacterium]
MLLIPYNLLFSAGFLLVLPYFVWRLVRRGKYTEGFWERFGFYPDSLRSVLAGHRVVWVHGVSVGEVNVALRLIEEMHARCPDLRFVLTTTTSRGYQVARQKAPEGCAVSYYPVDFLPCVASAFRTFKPVLLILTEGEIWPNAIWMAARRRIPCAIANADLSEKSEHRYRQFGFLFEQIFAHFQWVFTRTDPDKIRFEGLGVRASALHTVGSIKFDVAIPTRPLPFNARAVLEKGGLVNRRILVVGSTHEGEEEIILHVFNRLRLWVPDLFLILAPRHDERCPSVEKLLQEANIPFVRRTDRPLEASSLFPDPCDCLLINTTGELRAWFEAATVIFIGNSLTWDRKGGHNIVEGAVTGHPVVFGPNMEDWQYVADLFLREVACVQVRNGEELEERLLMLLQNPHRCAQIAERAARLIAQNTGAARKTAEILLSSLQQNVRTGEGKPK